MEMSLPMYISKTKNDCFFPFTKIRELEGRIGPAWRCWYQWEGRRCGKDM
jgi:hypothetical protein